MQASPKVPTRVQVKRILYPSTWQKLLKSVANMESSGAGGMPQWLRVLLTLPEDSSSDSSSRNMTLLASLGTLTLVRVQAHVCTHAHTQHPITCGCKGPFTDVGTGSYSAASSCGDIPVGHPSCEPGQPCLSLHQSAVRGCCFSQ